MPSSVIDHTTYDEERELLFVVFVSGRTYRYRDVPADVAAALQSASSKGGFFNRFIRDHYGFDEVLAGDGN